MDIIFEPQRGNSFLIEVGYFDTILEIKEKVYKYHGIPVDKQTLIFNGQILQDERNIEYSELFHNSRVQLFVSLGAQNHHVKIERPSVSSRKIQLRIRIPTQEMFIPVEVDLQNTVEHLKKKVQDMQDVDISCLLLHATRIKLQEHYTLCDYGLTDNQEIDVILKTSPTASATSSGNSTNKLKLMVLPKGGDTKILVEVNASENVCELRKELRRLKNELNLQLPLGEYFFIYKQTVMEEYRSFRWHQCNQGDTIEIFNGCVIGGI